MADLNPKEARRRAEQSLAAVSVRAGVSEVTARVFEADPLAVSRASARKLWPVYVALGAAPVEGDGR